MITDDPKIYHFPDPEWTPGKPGVDWQLVAAPKNVKTGAEANVHLLIADLFQAIETDTQSVASLHEARGSGDAPGGLRVAAPGRSRFISAQGKEASAGRAHTTMNT